MKLKATLFAAAATVAISPAAHAYSGLYGAIGAGLSYIGDDRDVEAVSGATFDYEADFEKGIGVYTALGHESNSGWRKELEFNYRNNDTRHWAGNAWVSGWPGSAGTFSSDISVYSVMANLIKDLGGGGGISPYIGAGIGYSWLDLEAVGTNPIAIGGLGSLAVNDTAGAFSYQGIAGLAFDLAQGVALDLSYRYFGTLEPEFAGTLNGVPITFDHEYTNHSVYAGLRWDFGGSAPVVQYKDCWDGSSVPVTSDCPPELVETTDAIAEPLAITVYFDYDKANLTPEASNLIAQTASQALASDINMVSVVGNTDTSGGADYNQRLSQRRANVVRDALVANGVPAELIDTSALGESNPAKATGDGVREPLNRRTEVTITFE